MPKFIDLELGAIQPTDSAVLQEQGVNDKHEVSAKIRDLLTQAMNRFNASAAPVALFADISVNDFADLFTGEGRNDPDALLADIFPAADRLALFALTQGQAISEEIENLLAGNDIALGYTLDTVASLAADNAVGLLEKMYADEMLANSSDGKEIWALGYSPGYCGWHISGQKKLFQYLQPELIGISLNDSFLMIPLKSVTGVFIAGDREIHYFKPNFTFCRTCRTKSCHARLRALNIERNG